MKKTLTISALGPSIGEQCADMGLCSTTMEMDLVDRISEALTLAHIHGILTDAEVDRARRRLIREAKLRPVDGTKR